VAVERRHASPAFSRGLRVSDAAAWRGVAARRLACVERVDAPYDEKT